MSTNLKEVRGETCGYLGGSIWVKRRGNTKSLKHEPVAQLRLQAHSIHGWHKAVRTVINNVG